MKYISGGHDFQLDRKSVVTLGKFDGLHRGHQKLIDRVLELGAKTRETVVFILDMAASLSLTEGFNVLLTNDERKKMVAQMGVDCLVEYPFCPAIKNMKPEDFVKKILVDKLKMDVAVVGDDFRFGHGRLGTPEMLARFGEKYGFTVEVIEKLCDGEREISSTYIREEIEKGNIEKANELLGYPYFITGKVIKGRHLGSTIGVPTINQSPEEIKKLPPFGVYTTRAIVGGKEYESVTDIGMKPTVGSDKIVVETHLFDCDENLYGDMAKVELYNFQRAECKFLSIEELKKQLKEDTKQAQEFHKTMENK